MSNPKLFDHITLKDGTEGIVKGIQYSQESHQPFKYDIAVNGDNEDREVYPSDIK